MPVPLVTYGELSETDPLDPDYVDRALRSANTSGGFMRLLSRPGPGRTLLEALLRQSVLVEYAIGSTLLVIDHELRNPGASRELPVHQRGARARGARHRAADVDPARRTCRDDAPSSAPVATATDPVELAQDRAIQEVSGNRTLANHLATTARTPSCSTASRPAASRAFRASLAAARRARPRPSSTGSPASTLDCVSHRLDAWVTSLATRRLDALRTERGRGSYVGGFGYVEDLRPSAEPVSRGYLHAPVDRRTRRPPRSCARATSPAASADGHARRRPQLDAGVAARWSCSTASAGASRSARCSATASSAACATGGSTLAKYILPMRQRSPPRPGQHRTRRRREPSSRSPRATSSTGRAARRLAARPERVLRQRCRCRSAARTAPTSNGLLERSTTLLDAVSDLLVAESVHQAVLGNAERSAAALDALDRQQPLPDVGVVRTPRTATGLSATGCCSCSTTASTRLPAGTTRDPRRAAEPRVDAWCGAVLGDPARYRFAAEVRDADGDGAAEAQRPPPRRSASPRSAPSLACGAAGSGTTELEQRLALHFGTRSPPPDGRRARAARRPARRRRADRARPARPARPRRPGQRPARRRAGRPTRGRCCRTPSAPTPGLDLAELRGRADAAVAALTAAVTALEALAPSSATDDMVDALLAAADAGVPGAVPGAEPPFDAGDPRGGSPGAAASTR